MIVVKCVQEKWRISQAIRYDIIKPFITLTKRPICSSFNVGVHAGFVREKKNIKNLKYLFIKLKKETAMKISCQENTRFNIHNCNYAVEYQN